MRRLPFLSLHLFNGLTSGCEPITRERFSELLLSGTGCAECNTSKFMKVQIEALSSRSLMICLKIKSLVWLRMISSSSENFALVGKPTFGSNCERKFRFWTLKLKYLNVCRGWIRSPDSSQTRHSCMLQKAAAHWCRPDQVG